jgi:hypothetical protein
MIFRSFALSIQVFLQANLRTALQVNPQRTLGKATLLHVQRSPRLALRRLPDEDSI